MTALSDGSGVLLDLESKFYFNLNESGVVIWRALSARAASGATEEELAIQLQECFGLAREAALADVRRFLVELGRAGLMDDSMPPAV